MSVIPTGFGRQLQFYLSGPLPCPYLPGRVERRLFTRLTHDTAQNVDINGMLTRAGFRRSHDIAYRPACTDCNACIPVRIPVRLFDPSRNLKRVATKNRDLRVEILSPDPTDELYELFLAYERGRHSDSDMAQMDKTDFALLLQEGNAETRIYALRDQENHLKGCIITDPVGDGLSAVYSFYDPTQLSRSLGTQLILSLIDEAIRERLSFVYLGYWIAASRKMAYKSRFKPLQALGPQGWDWVD
jgi:arginine-tRNA-protein transferase